MIAEHQPTIFGDRLTVRVSSRKDGNQSFRVKGAVDAERDDLVRQQRRGFVERAGATIDQTALVYVTYGDERDFQTLRVAEDIDFGRGMLEPGVARIADGLMTDRKEAALYLPLADCNGAVLFDESRPAFGVFHLGRHSTLVDTAKLAVERMEKEFGSDPLQLKAWISPGVGKNSYAMQRVPTKGHHDFANDSRWENFRRIEGDKVFIDLAGYNANGFMQAGVPRENIEISPVDTATTKEYPSHNNGDASRFAIIALMHHAA